jgi:hypothetical protein
MFVEMVIQGAKAEDKEYVKFDRDASVCALVLNGWFLFVVDS